MYRHTLENTGLNIMARVETEKGVIYEMEPEKEQTEEEIEAQETIDGILATLGGSEEVVLYLYRMQAGKSASYIAQMPGSEFTLDMLRDKYKGGRFKIIIKQGPKAVRSKIITVEPPPENTQLAQLQGADNTQALIFQMMQDNQRRSDNLLQTLIAKERPQTQSLFTPEMLTAFAAVLPHIKSLFGKAASGNEVELLLKGLELGKSLQGETSEKSLTDVMFKGVDALAGMLGQGKLPSPPQTPKENKEGEQKQLDGQTAEQQIMFNVMKQRLDPLVEAAKNNEDPWPYVGIIFNKVPIDYIKGWVIDEQHPVEKLSQVHPEIANYKEWFTKLVENIRVAYKEEMEDENGELIGHDNPE